VLAEDEQIYDVVNDWRVCNERNLRRAEAERLSNWYLTAWLTMLAAANREELRQMKKGREDHGA
jgi:hypothetical protein